MKLSLFLISLLTIFFVHAQNQYARVKIFVTNQQLPLLESIGIPADHGSRKANTWLVTDLSTSQIEALNIHNFRYDVLIEDVQNYYIERNNTNQTKSNRDDCASASPSFNPVTPNNFQLGTYAGFFTYQEFLDELDAMAAAYPNLITSRAAIDTFLTHENRPIYWVKISDNPAINETEPSVLYTALHHAREPASLSQLIFYMWYLLENYATDPEIAYLVNETELYFVPMLNPDGYLENEVSFPQGGGMHRKNKRNVGSTNPGVDLNRNYDYQWNVSGTSPNVNNDTYAGTNAFSEPETQAIKYFCEVNNFSFAMNAHSFGNLLLFPFGYANGAFSNDHTYFQAFSNHQVMFNNYNATKSSNLYEAAGDSDDWMYDGDLATKPKIYALTPEIGNGNDGFWPSSNRIIPLSKENIWQNKVAAHLPHVYGATRETDPNNIVSQNGYFHYTYQRLGLTGGPVSISIQPILNITTVGGINTHTINLMDEIVDSFSYALSPSISFGEEIIYVLNTNFGGWTKHDTIKKTFGEGLTAFADNGNDLTNWTGNWGLTNQYFVSPSTAITDSPGSNYSNGTNSNLVLNQSFDLSATTYASAQFYARWEIENDYDFVQFMASTDNGNTWTPLCGLYTNSGSGFQDQDAPLYDNAQLDWVLEEVDLSAYIGMSNLQLKFRLIADNFVTEDGFAFDDFKMMADGQDLSIGAAWDAQFNIYPNPAEDFFIINTKQAIQQITIYNQMGAVVLSPSEQPNKIETSELANGIYFAKIAVANGQTVTKKIIISK